MRRLRRLRPRLLLLAAVVLGSVGAAYAFFTSTGAGTASASVGTLSQPTITAAAAGAGTVSLSWSAVSAPASPGVVYYVTRAGGTVGGNCPTSVATATSTTSCTDSGLTKGTYTYTVTAVWQSWTATSASSQATLASGALSQFVVTAPATATAGTAVTATVTAEDAQGNKVTSYTGSQAITFSGPSNAPGGTAPTYPASVTFTNGSGSASITLYDAQTTTVTATQGSVSGTSGNITVSAGANHQIAASAASPQTAGTAFNVTLTAQDSWGNPTGNLTGTKNLTFSGPSKSPNNTSPTYPATATFSSGVATASVTLVDVQTTTITANDTTDSYNGTASNNITVNAGGASSFTVSAPATPPRGPRSPRRSLHSTHTATPPPATPAARRSRSPAPPPPRAEPPPPTQRRSPSRTGVGTASITLYDAQTTTVTATQGSVSGTSGNVTVSAGANHQIAASAASPQTAGTAFNVTLTAQDSWGNPTGNLTGTKNLTFSGPSKSPNNTSPTYPATATFSSGVATASVTLVDVQTTTITANDTTDSYNGTASNNITVNAGGASSFTVSAPATATAGTAFTETLTALDAYGNTATGYAGSQTITFTGPATSPGGTAPTYPAVGHLHQRRRQPLDHPLRRPDDDAHRQAGHDHRDFDVVHGRVGHRLADLVHDSAGGRDRRICVHHRTGGDRQGRLRQHGHRLHQDPHSLDQERHRSWWRQPHWLHQLTEQRRHHVRRVRDHHKRHRVRAERDRRHADGHQFRIQRDERDHRHQDGGR